MKPEDWGTLAALVFVAGVAVCATIGLAVVVRWVAHLF
jgi:hypothetical protein